MARCKTALAGLLILALCAATVGAAERSIVRRIENLDHDNPSTGAFRALVIGIDEYRDPEIRDLDTAVSDAEAVAEVLAEHYGFRVRTLLNDQATKAGLYNALREFAADASPSDSLLIYYAGHGELDRKFRGKDGWWIPADARANQEYTYLDNALVQSAIAKTEARHVLLISDSCYSGTLFGRTARALPPDITERYYLTMFNEQSRWGITSGNKTPVSDEGSAGHSIFAYQLLKHLCQNEKRYMSTQELYVRIAPVIGNNSSQTPMCRPIKGVNDRGGELVFIRKGDRTDGIDACAPFPLFADSGGTQVVVPPPEPPAPAEPGSLTVKSSEPGSTIAINGRSFEGFAPMTFTIKRKSTYTVRVTKPGYDPYEVKVEMGPGETRVLTAHLEKVDDGPVAPPAPVTPVTSEPEPGEIWREPTTGMEFVWVPGGTFEMGCGSWAGNCDDDEKPVHSVTLGGFWMGRHEVTVDQWERFVSETGYGGDGSNAWHCDGLGDPEGFSQEGDHPVACVSWKEATAFADWLSRKIGRSVALPTEAQWEYAARSGGKPQKYAGGGEIDAVAWYRGNSGDRTHRVGTKSANGLGLYDMSGNVWEWCSDWKGDYPSGSVTDPTGPSSGPGRVLRGGGWNVNARNCRSADRVRSAPDDRDAGIGFRLVLPAGQ